MKVYVFALYATVESSFGSDLEIIQKHLNSGDQVVKFTCPKVLAACDRNKSHDEKVCNTCVKRSDRGIGLLKNKARFKERSLTNYHKLKDSELNEFYSQVESFEKLREWKLDNFDIGYAILSSLVNWCQSGSPNLKDPENIDFLLRLCESSLYIYKEVDQILKSEKPDIVYVFNGRYAPMRAIVRASEKNNVRFYTHDRGGFDDKHYRLFENGLPHNLKFFTSERDRNWRLADKLERVIVAKNWFESKSDGTGGMYKSFIGNQEKDLLPKNWSSINNNYTIFTSSEREFSTIGSEWQGRLFANQVDGIRSILKMKSQELIDGSLKIYIRIHPNQAPEKEELERLFKLQEEGVIILPPDSNVSTYALMIESEKIITFGSTVGIEAVYWGTPSILLGQCFYKDLNATYNPETEEELFHLLSDVKLAPKPKELAYPHAYRMATFGEPYKYFNSTGFFTGLFHGKSMAPKPNSLLIKSLKRAKRFLLKGA